MASSEIVFTVLYDNVATRDGLKPAHGFSCLIDHPHGTILFDTGGDTQILLENMAALGKDPAAIDTIVISHSHWDHAGGLFGFLHAVNTSPRVVLPLEKPANGEFIGHTELLGGKVLLAVEPTEIAPGIRTTGRLDAPTGEHDRREHGLVFDTAEGPVVLTGCAPSRHRKHHAARGRTVPRRTGPGDGWVPPARRQGPGSRGRHRHPSRHGRAASRHVALHRPPGCRVPYRMGRRLRRVRGPDRWSGPPREGRLRTRPDAKENAGTRCFRRRLFRRDGHFRISRRMVRGCEAQRSRIRCRTELFRHRIRTFPAPNGRPRDGSRRKIPSAGFNGIAAIRSDVGFRRSIVSRSAAGVPSAHAISAVFGAIANPAICPAAAASAKPYCNGPTTRSSEIAGKAA